MSFTDALTQDLSVFFNIDEFATTVTYDSVSVSAIVDYGDSDYRVTKATLFVKVSDVALPKYRDEVIIDSLTWYVMRKIESNGKVWEIGIERDERPELL